MIQSYHMEIEPTPVNDHLAGIYRQLPGDTLAAEETRIREVLGDLAGKLIAIEQARETSNEHTVFA
jgi:hypothetical protein